MQKLDEKFLYLVVLGGRADKANIELHDVRWVVGSRIEDTYDVLKRGWFGLQKGLHIDSYKKIKYIDGYKINLRNVECLKIKTTNFLIKVIPKIIYGLLILEVMIQFLCRKNMSLD